MPASPSEATKETPGQLAALAEHGSAGSGALKRPWDPEDGAPPSRRQRRLHDGHSFDDAVRLETPTDLQILIVAFSASEEEQDDLNEATWKGDAAKASTHLTKSPRLR